MSERIRTAWLGSIILSSLLLNWASFLTLAFSEKSIELRIEAFRADTNVTVLIVIPTLLGLAVSCFFPFMSDKVHWLASRWRQNIRTREDELAIARKRNRITKETELDDIRSQRIAAATRTREEVLLQLKARSGADIIERIQTATANWNELDKDALRELHHEGGKATLIRAKVDKFDPVYQSRREGQKPPNDFLLNTFKKLESADVVQEVAPYSYAATSFGLDIHQYLELEEKELFRRQSSRNEPGGVKIAGNENPDGSFTGTIVDQ